MRAIIVNKFRGDPALFVDGVKFLEARTGVPVAGVIPHLGDARIASEDSLDLLPARSGRGARTIAIVKLPRLSNFDEFEPLQRMSSLRVRFVERPDELGDAALVIVPGTKCTVADLAWLRQTGLAGAIVARAAAGGAILGICGGYQLLGERILDPEGVESREPEVAGLGLLPVETIFQRDKVTHPVRVRLGDGVPLLDGAGGQTLAGYEIHCGRVAMTQDAAGQGARPFARVVRRGDDSADEREGCIRGAVAGTLVHGLFENDLVRAVIDGDASSASDPYETLADHFERALDMRHLDALVGL